MTNRILSTRHDHSTPTENTYTMYLSHGKIIIPDVVRSTCSFVIFVISSFISGSAGEVESLNLRSSHALILSNISVGTGSVLIWCCPEGMWCDAALRIMARQIFSPFGSRSEAVFCSACLQSLYCIGPSLPFSG